MWRQRTPEPRRLSAPPMCIRQELSAAVQTSAFVSSTARALSDTIALDTSAFFSEKVPPNPQHSSDPGRSTSSRPRTARSSRCGLSPRCSERSEWQDGCSVTVCGNEAPTSVTPSFSTRSSVNSNTRPSKAVDPPDERLVAGFRRHLRIMLADHRDAGRRRDADDFGAVEDASEMLHQRPRVAGVAGVVMHLPAAGLLPPELDLVAEPLEHGDDRLSRFREQRVVVAGDEQRSAFDNRRDCTQTRAHPRFSVRLTVSVFSNATAETPPAARRRPGSRGRWSSRSRRRPASRSRWRNPAAGSAGA